MSNQVQGVNNNIKAGTCPHGLAPGACPVCSTSGAGTLRQSDRNRKIGEMTYHECAMIGNMLRARALAQKNHERNLKERAESFNQFQNAMAKMAEVMRGFAQMISQSFIAKPVVFVAHNLILPVFNFVQNIPRILTSIIQKLLPPEISDKLAAIYGEAKAFINKKAEEFAKVVKSAFEGLFKILKKHNTDDEDTKIDDDKKIFNLKTMLHKIKEKFKRKKDGKNAGSTENQQ